ncbi:hypothetical protein PSQ19_09250 [Devosia algicola]|uniref:Uncharacterized protein n=1 Tax=Devosia algicola TaxID=3026418 RepID=A0ABY7YS45_9HYPH|nr:hypothetical protein [Devosia algicola]WDR04154.1 hypothetical protein PSQ19_09250 [Devosia algicola]
MTSLWAVLPVVVFASLLASVAFVIACQNTPAFAPVLVWAVVVWLINIPILHIYLARRDNITELDATTAQWISRMVVIFAVICGAMWGLGFHVLPVGESATIRQVATVGIGGILFVGMVALLNYPQALLGFVSMVLAGAMMARPHLSVVDDFWLRGLLLLGLVCSAFMICLWHVRHFVAHRASLNQIQEKGEIIGLLLREFESSASNWVWGFDKNGDIDRLSVGFTTATGLSEAEPDGRGFPALPALHYPRQRPLHGAGGTGLQGTDNVSGCRTSGAVGRAGVLVEHDRQADF